MIIVSDTSPLRYLIVVGVELVLPKLFGEIVIPPTVLSELQQPRTPEQVRQWANRSPQWLRIQAPIEPDPLLDLDAGEADAISLAIELNAAALLIDDRKGRNAATSRGIAVLGTLTVLEEAAAASLVDLHQTFDLLRQTNFRFSERMLREALERDRLRRGAD